MRGRIAAMIVGLALPMTLVSPASAYTSSTETMTHWSCDRGAKVRVTVTWLSPVKVKVAWKLTDTRRDGRSPMLRIAGVDLNGPDPLIRRNYFSGDGRVRLTGGYGTTKSGGRTWRAPLGRLEKVEAWIWNGHGSERHPCGYNVVKRVNNIVHTSRRTTPTGYADSKALRDRIVNTAMAEYRRGYHEYGMNCNKYTNDLQNPNVCHPWCSDFAWWVWAKAGVPGARLYHSSYTDDFADEWRVTFKKLGTKKPVKGDVMIWSHRTNGINGHIAVVVKTDGWRVRVVHGNWSDGVRYSGWINPWSSTNDGGAKHVIGFAAPV